MSKKSTSRKGKVDTAPPARPPVNLGTKRHCQHCNAKFYDFGKDELKCPKCGKAVDPHSPNSFKRALDTKRHAPTPRDPFNDEADVVVEDASDSDEDIDADEVTKDIDVDDDDAE